MHDEAQAAAGLRRRADVDDVDPLRAHVPELADEIDDAIMRLAKILLARTESAFAEIGGDAIEEPLDRQLLRLARNRRADIRREENVRVRGKRRELVDSLGPSKIELRLVGVIELLERALRGEAHEDVLAFGRRLLERRDEVLPSSLRRIADRELAQEGLVVRRGLFHPRERLDDLLRFPGA